MSKQYEPWLKATLARIDAAYLSGCASYWDGAIGNPWIAAHDELEKTLQTGRTQEIRMKLVWFEKTIMQQLSHYKMLQEKMAARFRG